MFVRNPIRVGRTRTQVFTMNTTTLWSDTDSDTDKTDSNPATHFQL